MHPYHQPFFVVGPTPPVVSLLAMQQQEAMYAQVIVIPFGNTTKIGRQCFYQVLVAGKRSVLKNQSNQPKRRLPVSAGFD